MKILTSLFLLFVLLAGSRALAHGGVEIGPHGGRVLEFSTDESLHGEITLTNQTFRVHLLDKDLKPLPLADHSLSVTGGDRARPQKPEVRREGNVFVFPALTGNHYDLVLRFKARAQAKPVTARFAYDATPCGGCQRPEWLCQCPAEKDDAPKAPVPAPRR